MSQFNVGDIVEPIPGSGTWLRSGASWYPCAVVISSDPLMLVSLETDMLWTATVEDMKLQVCGQATPKQLAACMKRKPKPEIDKDECVKVLKQISVDKIIECNCGRACDGTCTYARMKKALGEE